MRIIIFIVLFAFAIKTKAQITFEFTHDSAATVNAAIGGVHGQSQLMIVNFEISGYQYVKINRYGKYVSIYDMSHALVKTISLSGFPTDIGGGSNGVGDVLYLSEKLFNNDSKKEFMYIAQGSNPLYYTGIYNEDGTLLFSDTGAAFIRPNYAEQQYPIYNTSSGTKMILSYSNGQAKVFGLAGTLTTAIDRVSHSFAGNMGNAYPNPTNNSTTIEYNLPKEVNQGEIVFYDLQGIEVKRFKVDKTFNSLLISTTDIPAGTYYYQLQTVGNRSAGKKIVVVK